MTKEVKLRNALTGELEVYPQVLAEAPYVRRWKGQGSPEQGKYLFALNQLGGRVSIVYVNGNGRCFGSSTDYPTLTDAKTALRAILSGTDTHLLKSKYKAFG